MPKVAIMTDAEWEACADCDTQTLEGGPPLRFTGFPAVTADGALIAVTEERDGWHHVPVPGVRMLDRTGATVAWLPVDGTGALAAEAVRAVNAELARHAWTPIVMPERDVVQVSDDVADTTVSFGRFTATYRMKTDGYGQPPWQIRVVDELGRVVIERHDIARAWAGAPACNMPAFSLVGVSAVSRVMLFTTGLGMGGHNCDGVVQRPHWHVLAF